MPKYNLGMVGLGVMGLNLAMNFESNGFSSSLSYYDSYRAEVLPARLVQAQRDFFGAHSYERIDKPRGQLFHTEWE